MGDVKSGDEQMALRSVACWLMRHGFHVAISLSYFLLALIIISLFPIDTLRKTI